MFKVIWNAIVGRKCGLCRGRTRLKISICHGTYGPYDLPIWECKCGACVLNGWEKK